jgi:hypothetical protein
MLHANYGIIANWMDRSNLTPIHASRVTNFTEPSHCRIMIHACVELAQYLHLLEKKSIKLKVGTKLVAGYS